MLEPNQRQHFIQALSPPDGYDLSFAIGTTYSLDLLALLSTPLAFAQFDWEDDAGQPASDPMALLESLRRYADRVHIFCQAGGISVPTKAQLLLSYLENSVFQVQAPFGGAFHPKIWALRFTAPDKPVFYRLLCLSRNLTFDRSWDTLLAMQGEVVERQRAYAVHHPLGDLIKSLQGLAMDPVPEHVRKNIEIAQYELRRVNFYLPDGFESYAFWTMGIQGYTRKWPLEGRIDRLLVVSPFLTPDCLQRLTEQGGEHILMSRLDSLAALGERDLRGFKKVFALNPIAEVEELSAEPSESALSRTDLSGLHAKLYVIDDGWNARVFTGSANATHAAFNTNVEFMVELFGKKAFCGVDAFMKTSKEQFNFADLWVPFGPNIEGVKPDPIQHDLEQALRLTQKTVVSGHWQGKVDALPEKDMYLLEVSPGAPFAISRGVEVLYWPVTLSDTSAGVYGMGLSPVASFGPLAFESLTAFIVFRLTARILERVMSTQFMLNIPLTGAPVDRRDRLLRAMLRSRDQVLRFLIFLLSDGKDDFAMDGPLSGEQMKGANMALRDRALEMPLFESLVQTLHSDPARLDQIARIVADLERTPEGQELLPEGFNMIWAPIWKARQKLLQ